MWLGVDERSLAAGISNFRRGGFHLLVAISSVIGLCFGCTTLDPETDTAVGILNQGGQASGGVDGAGVGNGGTGGGEVPIPEAWSCLTSPVVPVERESQPIQYIVPIVDFNSQSSMPTPVADLTVTVCGSPDCESPGKGALVIHPVPGLPDFVWMIRFDYGFDNGYLRLTAPGYIPMHYVLGGPMIGTPEGEPIVRGLPIPLLKTTTLDTLYEQIGLGPFDPTRGVLAVRTLDCRKQAPAPSTAPRAAGVRLGPPLSAVPWALSFGNVATANKLVTDSRGVTGFAHVVPSGYVVHGVAPVGPPEGTKYGETTLAIKPGVITLGEVRDGIDRWGQ